MKHRDVSGAAMRLVLPVLLLSVPLLAAGAGPAGPTPAVKSLGVHPHEAGDVDVVLLEVARTSGETVTVHWTYVNKSDQAKRLTAERTGWIDPYRLAADAYLLDTIGKTKYTVLVDDDRRPIAGRHGRPNAYIVLGPRQSLATWAKFPAPPAGVRTVTVSIPGVEPFEDVPLAD